MSNSIARDDPSVKVIVGVDTHKHEHVAVAINDLGAGLATFRVPANGAGYADLVAWARTLGDLEAFGIEGTGSYGVGLARFVRRQGLHVVEVNRCDRRKRRNNGKSDTLDAEAAARSVLAGVATAMPKAADGAAEMVRQIKIARDTAVKARTTAMTTLKTLLVNAPSCNWVEQARADRTKGKTGLTTAEREELARLRKEVRELRMERDVLKKAAAFFARDHL